MFFDSNNFRKIEAGVQLSWMQQQLHLQNISNIETPGYKAQSLSFAQVLESAEEGGAELARINAKVVEDDSAGRPDGNNVNLETESIEAYKAYVQYTLLLEKAQGEFNKYQYVLNSGMN